MSLFTATRHSDEPFAFFRYIKGTREVFVCGGVAIFEIYLQETIERIKIEGPGKGQESFSFLPASGVPNLFNGRLPNEGNVMKEECLKYLPSVSISYMPKVYGSLDGPEFPSRRVQIHRGTQRLVGSILQVHISLGKDFDGETYYITVDSCDTEEGIRAVADAILRMSQKLEADATLDWENAGSTQGL